MLFRSQEFRSLEKNRAEALRRLQALVDGVAVLPKVRRPTKPTRSAVAKRLDSKARLGRVKAGRSKPIE